MKYKGQIEGWPEEVVNKMIDCQEEQGNHRDVTVFEECCSSDKNIGGFNWGTTPEGDQFWRDVIVFGRFNRFFERYPKDQPIEPVNSHPFATYELVNYDSPEGTSLVMGSFAKCKEEMKPGNILRPLDKSSFIRYNKSTIFYMRKRALTASTEELRSMVYQCLDALGE